MNKRIGVIFLGIFGIILTIGSLFAFFLGGFITNLDDSGSFNRSGGVFFYYVVIILVFIAGIAVVIRASKIDKNEVRPATIKPRDKYIFYFIIILAIVAVLAAIFLPKIINNGSNNKTVNQVAQPATNVVTQPISQTDDWKTYTNDKYGYSIKYPSDWIVQPEQQFLGAADTIFSSVRFHDPAEKHAVSIVLRLNEWLLRYEAPKVEQVAVEDPGPYQTAYIFPNGWECNLGIEKGDKYFQDDCSFFNIPIFGNGMWYNLGAFGDAKTVGEPYISIFATFNISRYK